MSTRMVSRREQQAFYWAITTAYSTAHSTAHSTVTSQYRDPDSFQTTSNEAYNVVKRQAGREGGKIKAVGGEYEAVPPTSSQPNTTAAGDYEPV